MDDYYDDDLPQWRRRLKIVVVLLGLLAMAAGVMGLILLIAHFFDKAPGEQRVPAPIHIDISSKPSAAQNYRTQGPSTFGFDILSNPPGRPAGVSFKSEGPGRSERGTQAPAAAANANEYTGPVGVSVEEYRAAAASGKPMFIPNPKGECDLSGASAAQSVSALDSCFAERVAAGR
jgi:hypothetical protein